ncbi:hypothetical protein NQ314_010069, partial [Rhamnusium bicolor]
IENGDVLLLAASMFDGIKCFQYDGWHFVESKTQFKNEITSRGIKAMHSYKFQNKTVVVIANEYDKGNMINILEVKFSLQNEVQRMHKEMLMWCLDKKKIIEETYYSNDVLGKPARGDMSMESNGFSGDDKNGTEQIPKSIKSYKSELDEIEHNLKSSLQLQNSHIIDYNLTANQIILSKDGILNSPEIEMINNVPINTLLENILNINEGFDVDSTMEFNFLRVEEPIFPQNINNISAGEILHKSDDFNIDNLIINGSVNFLNEVNVLENVNGLTIDNRSILLQNCDQDFDEFRVKRIDVNNLETALLNKIEIKSVENLLKNTEKIKSLTELKAHTVAVGGYINNVDLSTLQKYALRKANNLETNLLSGKNVFADFVSITGGKYIINKDVKFSKDLFAHNLTVLKYLDSIPVKNMKLDILLKDSTERQYIAGIKSFENLELLNPIKLQGKIRSKDLDTMNPVVTIGSNLDLNGDIRITGDVIVEETIKSNDTVTSNRNSLHRLQQQGLKLTEPKIPIHLNFSQHIIVSELFADKINNIDPRSWVVNGAKQTQIIQGWKQFLGDLEITGDTSVFKINDIDMAELETNVLRKNGDQVISGKHYVKIVGAEKRYEDGMLIVEENQEFDKITVHGTVYVESNYVNDVNLTDFENNTIKIDEPFHFNSATFNHIIVNDTIELDGHVENLDLDNIFQNNIEETQIIIDDIVFHDDVIVEGKVHFENSLNEFNVSDICDFSSTTKQMKDLIVKGNGYFAKGPYTLEFNGHNVKNLQDTIWFKDKPTVLNGNIEFNNVTFKDNVTVMGLLNDVNLKLLFTNYFSKSKDQSVSAHMNFLDEVFFAGEVATPNIILGGEVNDINFNEFVKTILLHEPQLFENALYFENCIVGSVQGDYLVNKLNFENEVMRYDKPNVVTGYKKFENLAIDNLNTDRNITVQNVDILNWIRNSIVTDGNFRISGKKYFKNVTLHKGMSLMGLLNGQKFSNETVMLKNVPQQITGRKTFIRDTSKEIKFKALKVKGLVNNADIAELVHNQVAAPYRATQ